MTLNGNILSDPDWMPGDSCCALFALTKDEYELKDNDVNGLNELIQKLYNNIPEDRLMEAYYSTIDKQRRPMHPRSGCKTMDNNKFEKYRQRNYALQYGIPFFNTVDKVYMVFCKDTTDRLPAITWDGFANIFTQREYAENIIKNAEIDNLDIREFSKADFDSHIKTWYAFGIQKFNLNAGTKDHACTIMRDDYLPDKQAKEWEYSGSTLCMYLWRYRQYITYKADSMMALAQTMFNLFCHELKETLLLCPFVYEDDVTPLPAPDYILHTSQGSIQLITKKTLREYIGNPDLLESLHQFEVTVNGEKVMPVNDDLKFYNGEKYSLANPSNISTPKVMLPLTVNVGSGAFVPAFTDFYSLHGIFGENVRVALYTYDELRNIADNARSVNGIIINPNTAAFMIWKKDMDLIEKISREEKTFYISKADKDNLSDNKETAQKDVQKELKQCRNCGTKYPISKLNSNDLCPICVYKSKKENETKTDKRENASSNTETKQSLLGKIKKLFK